MIRRLLVVVGLVGGAAACGDIPQPFRHEGAPASLARPKHPRAVAVRAPQADGGPALAEALVKGLEDQEVPAVVQDGPAFGHVIESHAEDQGRELAVTWTLKAPDGTEAASHRQSVPKSLLAPPQPARLKRLAAESAVRLAQPLADPDAQPVGSAQPAAMADNRIAVAVIPLRGLPGDGDRALTLAITRALDRGNVLVKDEGADYMVEGKVTVAPGLPGEDTVTVAWLLKRAKDGMELGNIGQQGAVPRGRLAGAWGSLARDIAEGGAAGLTEVIRADRAAVSRK